MQDPCTRFAILILDEDEEAMATIILLNGGDRVGTRIAEVAIHAPNVIRCSKRVVAFVLEPSEQGVVRYWTWHS